MQKAALIKEIGEKREQQRSKEVEMENLGRFMVGMRAALYTISAVLDHVRAPEEMTEMSAPQEYRWNPQEDWLEHLYARKFEPERKAPKENGEENSVSTEPHRERGDKLFPRYAPIGGMQE